MPKRPNGSGHIREHGLVFAAVAEVGRHRLDQPPLMSLEQAHGPLKAIQPLVQRNGPFRQVVVTLAFEKRQHLLTGHVLHVCSQLVVSAIEGPAIIPALLLDLDALLPAVRRAGLNAQASGRLQISSPLTVTRSLRFPAQ